MDCWNIQKGNRGFGGVSRGGEPPTLHHQRTPARTCPYQPIPAHTSAHQRGLSESTPPLPPLPSRAQSAGEGCTSVQFRMQTVGEGCKSALNILEYTRISSIILEYLRISSNILKKLEHPHLLIYFETPKLCSTSLRGCISTRPP